MTAAEAKFECVLVGLQHVSLAWSLNPYNTYSSKLQHQRTVDSIWALLQQLPITPSQLPSASLSFLQSLSISVNYSGLLECSVYPPVTLWKPETPDWFSELLSARSCRDSGGQETDRQVFPSEWFMEALRCVKCLPHYRYRRKQSRETNDSWNLRPRGKEMSSEKRKMPILNVSPVSILSLHCLYLPGFSFLIQSIL